MGLGTLHLYADTDADPRELLAPFAFFSGFPSRSWTAWNGWDQRSAPTSARPTAALRYTAACAAPPCARAAATGPLIAISAALGGTAWCRWCPRESILLEDRYDGNQDHRSV